GFGRQRPNDWGGGTERRDHKDPHWTGASSSPETFGHFGQSGTFLSVDPRAGAACGGLTDRAFGEWAAEAWPRLAESSLAALWARRRCPGPHLPPSLPRHLVLDLTLIGSGDRIGPRRVEGTHVPHADAFHDGTRARVDTHRLCDDAYLTDG